MLTEVIGGPGLALLALLGTLPSTPNGTPPYETRSLPGNPCPMSSPFVSMPGAAPSLRLPTALHASLRERFDLDTSATFAGSRPDLNGDGAPDWVVWVLGPGCGGTGNCAAALADGRDQRLLGTFVASALLISPQRHGWPDVQAFAALGEAAVTSATWTTRGDAYRTGRPRRMARAAYVAEIARTCALGR